MVNDSSAPASGTSLPHRARHHGLPAERAGGDLEATLAVLAELLFVVLPLIVLLIVDVLYHGKPVSTVLGSPELSFAATVLLGQSVVKLVAGTRARVPLAWEKTAFWAAAVIVLGLVPASIVLAILLNTESTSRWLVDLQLGLFVFGVVAFIVFGAIGHTWLRGKAD